MKKLSQEEILKLVSTLKRARRLLRNERCEFLCGAVYTVCGNRRENWSTRDYLSKWINKMLNGKLTLDEWLQSKGCVQYSYPTGVEDDVRATRIRWVNWMINELKKELK